MSDRTMNHERYEEMAAAYAIGALDAAEVQEFEEHLVSCERCPGLLAEFSSVGDALVLAAEPAAPPPALREKILVAAGVAGAGTRDALQPPASPAVEDDTVRRTRLAEISRPVRSLRRTRRGPNVWMPLALAALAALAFVSWQAWNLREQVQTATQAAEESRRELETQTTQLDALKTELQNVKATAEEREALVRLLTQPESGLVTLASLAPAPGASGKVLWDTKAGRGYLWVFNLPEDPEGKDSQLWAIAGKTPVSAGVFSVQNGSALVPLESLPPAEQGVAAFAITIEPAGGVPAPTGDMVLIGNVKD